MCERGAQEEKASVAARDFLRFPFGVLVFWAKERKKQNKQTRIKSQERVTTLLLKSEGPLKINTLKIRHINNV